MESPEPEYSNLQDKTQLSIIDGDQLMMISQLEIEEANIKPTTQNAYLEPALKSDDYFEGSSRLLSEF